MNRKDMIFDQHEDGDPSRPVPSGPFWLRALLAPLFVFGAVLVLTGIAIGAGSAGANAAFALAIRAVFVFSPFSNLRPEGAESGLGNLACLAVATVLSARAGKGKPLSPLSTRILGTELFVRSRWRAHRAWRKGGNGLLYCFAID